MVEQKRFATDFTKGRENRFRGLWGGARSVFNRRPRRPGSCDELDVHEICRRGFLDGVQDMPAPGKLTLRALAPLYVIPISDPLVHGNFDRHGRNLFPTFCSSLLHREPPPLPSTSFGKDSSLCSLSAHYDRLGTTCAALGLDRSSPDVMPILESRIKDKTVEEKRKFC